MGTVFEKSIGTWACWSSMKNCSGLEGFRDRIPMMEMKEGLEGSNSIPMRLSIGTSVVWLIRETRDLMIASLYEIKWIDRIRFSSVVLSSWWFIEIGLRKDWSMYENEWDGNTMRNDA